MGVEALVIQGVLNVIFRLLGMWRPAILRQCQRIQQGNAAETYIDSQSNQSSFQNGSQEVGTFNQSHSQDAMYPV